ncbi:hypothetical protein K502DRAFT_368477 [Neoconidiobolus thromboides FSU 785]|nr:hypothetical protein K502DRAFT_368477 [Neoconidiobolus thromboides FSU 785]
MKFINIASLLSFGTIVFSTTLPSGSIAHPINQSADIFPSDNSNNNNQLDNGIFNNSNEIQHHDIDPDFNKYPNKPPQSNKKVGTKYYIGKKLIKKSSYPLYSGYDTVKEIDLPKPYRIITPYTLGVTLDYNPDRLNLVVDKNYIIKEAYYV